jgi:hypothetical protein
MVESIVIKGTILFINTTNGKGEEMVQCATRVLVDASYQVKSYVPFISIFVDGWNIWMSFVTNRGNLFTTLYAKKTLTSGAKSRQC